MGRTSQPERYVINRYIFYRKKNLNQKANTLATKSIFKTIIFSQGKDQKQTSIIYLAAYIILGQINGFATLQAESEK